jgi:hypothetical protein
MTVETIRSLETLRVFIRILTGLGVMMFVLMLVMAKMLCCDLTSRLAVRRNHSPGGLQRHDKQQENEEEFFHG